MIILSFIIGIILFYTIIIPSVHKLLGFGISQKLTRRILSLPFWQIILCDLVCLYALQVEPVYKQTDEDINNFVQEYSAIGDLVNEYTGINTASNYNYLMSEAENLHTHTVIFMVVTVIFVLTVAIGSIGRKLDRRIVEGMSIITTLGCCWIAKSSTDLYEMTIRDGATLQAIAWFGRLLGTDIYLMMDLIIRSVWILPLILIIKQFYYHKTLNEYYALVVPQSSFIKRQEENKAEEQSKSPYIGFAIGGIVIIIIAVFVVWQCTKNEDVMPTFQQAQQEEVNSTTGATQQDTKVNTSENNAEYSNQFKYIKEKRGNYEVEIEWPVSLIGMNDISEIQLAIIQKTFGRYSHDINSCVENFFTEEKENTSLGEGETEGKITVKFQQRLNNLFIFKIQTYADLGGGTGLSVVYKDEYLYFDRDTNQSLKINALFTDYSKVLALVNEHISLEEYASKADELPDNFIISSSGITFIFPKYSIGYGYQGEVEIALTYEELNNVLSNTFKNAIGK